LFDKFIGTLGLGQWHTRCTDLVRDELVALAPPDAAPPIPLEMVVQYTVSAFMGLLMWCVDHETPDTPAQMDAIFQRLTLPGVRAGLGWTTSSSETAPPEHWRDG